MTYYIISEIGYAGGNLIYTPVAYGSTEEANIYGVSIQSGINFNTWVDSNKGGLENGTITPESYILSVGTVYEIGWVTDNIDGLDLPHLDDTDITITLSN